MFLFVITDLYDLNNSRVLIEFLAERGYDVTAYFCLTPLKAYRKVFLTNCEGLFDKVEMSDKVKKVSGHMTDFHEWMKNKQFEYTFMCCSFYPLFKKLQFFNSKPSMGKICMISWGFDGCDVANYEAYHHADFVFAEGPFFYSRPECCKVLKDWKHKIHFSHPYYDVFENFTQEDCRKKLGIETDKGVILIAETGNIKAIKTKWTPLYRSIISRIPRDLYYVIFKAREKLVQNPCSQTIAPCVDKYIENEWIYPPCSAAAAIASDICILPCESRYVLEAVMSKKPTIMHSQVKYKNKSATRFFGAMAQRFRFNSWSSVPKGTIGPRKALANYEASMNWCVSKHEEGNCQNILNIIGV